MTVLDREALPSRSFLFVPGARPERFEKALAAGADAICIDLEDSVPPEQKDAARAAALDFIANYQDSQTPVWLRLNGLRTAAGLRDLAVVAETDLLPSTIMLPKVDHAEEVAIASSVIADPTVRFVPIVESAAGLANAQSIARAPRVTAMLFGAVDFTVDTRTALEWEPLLFARSQLALAAAAADIEIFDVPYLDVEDEAGLEASTRRVKALGFTGRACIHPKQVATINRCFTPSEDEIKHAWRVMDAFEAAQGGAALLDGKMIELPVVKSMRRILALATRG